MKSRFASALVALFLVLSVAVFALTSFAQKPKPAGEAAVRWEHLALTHDDAVVGGGELSKQIVRLGDEGWELVTVSTVVKDGATTKTVFYFKRRK